MTAVHNYILVTAAYWGFTLTDGALRMLVLLHFHELGYSPVELAFLFLFYEFFGVVTNLVGGWIASQMGLKVTLFSGLALQIVALGMLSAGSPAWSRVASVVYVMAVQSLSGVAKDLTKMSAKSSIKVLVPEGRDSLLFKWVALLTGSKNALKGVGFFLGGLLLTLMGFKKSLWAMAGALLVILIGAVLSLPATMGKAKKRSKFSGILSKSREINVLSAARFFLFGSRDIWFVVGVPVFLAASLGWSFAEVGGFLAAWVIGYGIVQSVAPALIARWTHGRAPDARAAQALAFSLAGAAALIAVGTTVGRSPAVMLGGLVVFGVVFAINSSVHSYLILAYSDGDQVAMNVGFYYMANAGGRLVGTLISGIAYQLSGVAGCLWASAAFAAAAGLLSLSLPPPRRDLQLAELKGDAGGGG
jgi:MFS transporter, APGE family, 1-arseno-3-phosphoglycerate exporter